MPTERGAWGLAASVAVSLLGCSKSLERPTPPGDLKPAVVPSETRTPSGSSPANPEATQAPALPLLIDHGVFSDLDGKVSLSCPEWLKGGPHLVVASRKTKRTWISVDGILVCEGPRDAFELESTVVLDRIPQDRDEDGVPDAIDVLRGAKKTAKNGAKYENHYRELAFPGGDVPREEGVCTDVIIRSLRNAGLDLQQLVAEDIQRRPGAYPMVKKPDAHIDHRRVRTLLPYFEAHTAKLPTDPRDSAFPYLPGDIVFMNTMGDREPEHVGVVIDELGRSGLPLVVNNWTEGTVTKPMDLLPSVPVTHRFRTTTPLRATGPHGGLEGVLKRAEISLPEDVRQVVLVTTPLFESTGGTLRHYVQSENAWTQRGAPVPVRIGRAGLAEGRGMATSKVRTPTEKQEGDKKAPAGVFRLGTAFGTQTKAPYRGPWPYRSTGPDDYWIDDPKSPDYNRWITLPSGETMTWSAERLSMYSLGLVVEHNTASTKPGAGSAIFIHPWKDPETTTVGCTALDSRHLVELIGSLDPRARPVLIQLAGSVL